MDKQQEQVKRERTHLSLQMGRLGQRRPAGFSWQTGKKPPVPELPPHVKVALWDAAVGILKLNAVAPVEPRPTVYGLAELRASYPGAA